MHSQFCEKLRPWRRRSAVGCVRLALLFAVSAAPVLAGVEDDFRAGEATYKRGDIVGAIPVLRGAADKGHAPAQVLLAEILDRAEYNEEALTYYRKAAEQGSAAGEFGLATMLEAGEGIKKDPQQAYTWYARAAERGHEPAIIALANAYIVAARGKVAPPADQSRAGQWIVKAAALEFTPAVEALAVAYRDGGFGLAPDAGKAAEFAARVAAIRKKAGADAKKARR